ncbi:flagellar motor protein PomA [Inmirania thermothiophila]|uniref:Chemotaxis protein MotA n=1 Tax=Inmirania thermothiophila TaxID=1750597 RepID=A0A3N1Y7I6_9GAMM|nr:flagellar motor protein PomA [Inmirania thermothiophila]ROR34789.1 chemotaxis protein MotA [Inmirania thermothiophila]
MDLATLIGLLFGLGIVVGSILMGSGPGIFVNPPSLLIVVGGTIAATLIKFPLANFLSAFSVAAKAFIFKIESPEELIKDAVRLAETARKAGLLELEKAPVKNEFFKKGLQLVVDGHDAALVRKMLTQEMNLTVERHETGQKIWKAIGDSAPAMGMIGTLIGLVQLMANMDDPKKIGPAMAVALLTTLYGSLIANLVALPIAEKLELRSEQERTNKSLIIEAINAIQDGMNPRVLDGLLKAYLPGKKRDKAKAK